jgi:hypothetical protein
MFEDARYRMHRSNASSGTDRRFAHAVSGAASGIIGVTSPNTAPDRHDHS